MTCRMTGFRRMSAGRLQRRLAERRCRLCSRQSARWGGGMRGPRVISCGFLVVSVLFMVGTRPLSPMMRICQHPCHRAPATLRLGRALVGYSLRPWPLTYETIRRNIWGDTFKYYRYISTRPWSRRLLPGAWSAVSGPARAQGTSAGHVPPASGWYCWQGRPAPRRGTAAGKLSCTVAHVRGRRNQGCVMLAGGPCPWRRSGRAAGALRGAPDTAPTDAIAN